MPPKFKFTKQEIIDAAVELTRQQGISALTARSLATRLGTSAKPIFGLFQNMQEVHSAVIQAADALYQTYLQRALGSMDIPPYKASGMAYIQFAKEEKELFKLLFMRDRTGEAIEEDRQSIRPLLVLIMTNLSITEDEAYLLHMELWVYVHGIATMLATGYLDWDMEFISNSLTDVYQGLKSRYTGGNVSERH